MHDFFQKNNIECKNNNNNNDNKCSVTNSLYLKLCIKLKHIRLDPSVMFS